MALRTGDLLMNQFKKSPNWKQLSDSELQCLKNTMLSIAADFVDVCEKNNLTYVMVSGTALGAVRHHGFIPWDDDMDFCMPRKDYTKFLKISETLLGDKYYICSVAKGDKTCIPSIHIRLKGSYYVNYGDLIMTANEPNKMRGIYIDIFPLDNASDIRLFRLCKGILCLSIQYIISCIHINESVKYLKRNNISLDKDVEKALRIKKYLGKIFGMKSMVSWNRLSDKILSSNNNNSSKYVTCYLGKHIKKDTFLRDDFFEPVKGEFEGYKWNLPKKYDKYLKQVYGNYMKMPNKAQQKIHPVFYLKFPNS